jgi:hypothetical protein
MGILDFFMGIQDPIEGRYRITKVSKPPTNSSVGSCDMVGDVAASGVSVTGVEHTAPFASVSKWPRVGDILPVRVDRDNPADFMRVQWKDVPEHAE